jgi:hypothetical protein
MTERPDYPPIRRVITGHDANNVAKVLIDAPATNAKKPSAGTLSTLIWCTDRSPADIAGGETAEDMGARLRADRRRAARHRPGGHRRRQRAVGHAL